MRSNANPKIVRLCIDLPVVVSRLVVVVVVEGFEVIVGSGAYAVERAHLLLPGSVAVVAFDVLRFVLL